MLSCILKYRCLLYQLCYVFEGRIFITKNSSCYCKWMIKRKVGSLRKLSKYYKAEASILCTEAANSYFHLCGCGYHPQPCRWSLFGSRYTWGGWRPRSTVFGILWLKPNTTVVMYWTMGCSFFFLHLYMACDVCITY